MAIRAVHFAATAVTAGVLAFALLIAPPELSIGSLAPAAMFERRCRRIAWLALAVAIVTGALWVLAEIVVMTERSLADAITDGLVSIILLRTNFGLVCDVRLVIAVMLAAALARAGADASPPARWIALVLAAALLASLAWAGHAVGTPGRPGDVHVIGDALHLLAAGAWIGGLLPLGLILTTSGREDDASALAVAAVTHRFSTMAMVSVATLIVTGFVNAWILVGSWPALTATNYGRLLIVKLALFAAMLGFAAVNRFVLTPVLAHMPDALPARRKLARNSMIELALGLLIFVAVGVLGELHPAIHMFRPKA